MAMRKRVPRGGFVSEKPDDGEELVAIYISREAYARLQEDQVWYQGMRYCRHHSSRFPIRMRVARSELKMQDILIVPPHECGQDGIVKRCEVIPPPYKNKKK